MLPTVSSYILVILATVHGFRHRSVDQCPPDLGGVAAPDSVARHRRPDDLLDLPACGSVLNQSDGDPRQYLSIPRPISGQSQTAAVGSTSDLHRRLWGFRVERPQLGGQSGVSRSRLCENSRARFLPVNFSHVGAISGDISAPIRVLAILRGGRNEFSHGLGQKRTYSSSNWLP
jgi:hypothetical protein